MALYSYATVVTVHDATIENFSVLMEGAPSGCDTHATALRTPMLSKDKEKKSSRFRD